MGLREIAVLLGLAVAAGAMAPALVKARLSDSASPAKAASPTAAAETGTVALHAASHGHFYADAVIEGRTLRMVVDTGASLCALPEEDAERLGLRLRPGDFTREVSTANGLLRVAPVRLGSVQIGSIVVRDVEAVVVPRGRLGTGLLGMSFLKRLRDFSIAGGRLTLRG
ncbi:protease [Methylobacterium sp. Leaf456]|uniref:retropepsin-like aspartic protease family protein n=1 Tax=Methylobacterium sp. Leaf456 TaxID=1736382 RepID=UPI0006F67295|nr:TIGR02281 family clan AA aspartic protease [Methylobacterium sp. Leaf456]KQT53613.1 protease [Methylobacterium sp. Leaf456]